MATVLFLSALAVVALPSAHAAGEPPSLAHNPFSRPPSKASDNDVRIVESDDGPGPTIALHATMVGSAKSLANVGGRILKTGDEIGDYVLVEIHEDYAVFKRNGKLITVFVKPQLAEEDE